MAITHRNVTRFLGSLDLVLAGRVWTQWHSLVFDVSVWDIFGALLHGGRFVVVPDEVARSPQDLHAVLMSANVSGAQSDSVGAAGGVVVGGVGVGGVGGGR